MTGPPFAHAGHWLGQLAYLGPLVILAAVALWSKFRNRGAGPRDES
jgi:hypothetical protein